MGESSVTGQDLIRDTSVNFGDEILLRGEECKTPKKFNFSEK